MVDLSKIRRGSPKAPPPLPAPAARGVPARGMPAPPKPASDVELPAPTRPGMPSRSMAPHPPEREEHRAPPKEPPHSHEREPAKPRLPETSHKEHHGSPPVFIKIDKYSDIVKNLQKLKSYAMSLRDALDALSDIEKEITTGISIAHKALDDFNTIIAVLDSKLLKASAIEDFDLEAPGDVDRYIKGIYDQMEKIKGDLKEMSG